MRSLFFIILLSLSCCLSVTAVDFEYQGDKPVNRKAIENGFNRLVKNKVEIAAGIDSVSAWLSAAGYLDNVVKFENNRVLIETGSRYRLEKLFVLDSIESEFTVNEYFTKTNFDRATHRLLQSYYYRGYYYARADIAAVKHHNRNRVTVEMTVNRGPLVTVGRQVLIGLM